MIYKNKIIYVIVFVILISNIKLLKAESLNKGDNSENLFNVLYINSYNLNFPNTQPYLEGINSVFDEYNILLDIEYMDSKRFFTKEHLNNFYKLIKYKMQSLFNYDAILVTDDNALQFILDYYDELFYETPIFFAGINDLDRVNEAAKKKNITGVFENLSIKENISIGMSINPNSDTVIAIIDDSLTGIGDSKQFYLQEKNFANLKFMDVNFSNYTLDNIENILNEINVQKSIIIYLSMYNDSEGNYTTIEQASKILSKSLKTPILRAEINGIGDGILGGSMVDYSEQASIASKMLINNLTNSSSKISPIYTKRTYKNIFDYNIIKQYNIDKKSLPEDSYFINHTLSFFEENKEIVRYAICTILISIIIIIYLIYLNLKNYIIIKKMKIQEKVITKLINYDELTNLPNRKYFLNELDKTLEENRSGVLMLIDLDEFKRVNDTKGHIYGNKLLKEVSNIISSLEIDNEVLIARYGGDEFLILIKDIDYSDNPDEPLYTYITNLIDAFSEPIKIEQSENYVFISMGISIFTKDNDFTAEQLLMQADTAMYKVKQLGRNGFIFYNDNMKNEIICNLKIENKIRDAIKNDNFKLVYQPKVSAKTGEIISFEALLRFKDDSMSPSIFIPVAENTNQINAIGRWVTKEAIIQLSKWSEMNFLPKKISINFSNAQISDTGYYDYLETLLKEYDVSPSLIELEITEGIFLKQSNQNIKFLERIKDLGVKIHLDDFGSGYSALRYLTFLPIDKVKLDKYFCDNYLLDDNIDVMFNLISLIHSFNIEVVAEGVEKHHQFLKLQQCKCDYIQGYLFSKPLDITEINEKYNKTYTIS